MRPHALTFRNASCFAVSVAAPRKLFALYAPAILLFAAILPANSSWGESGSSTSQTVYVQATEALVYSGPSEDFYPTGRLSVGQNLSVFHRTKDGWLGIKPPEGSFSWVPAVDAYLLPGGQVIEITRDKAVCWIGTQLGAAKQFRWQVELKAGEQLSLRGEAKMKSADGKENLWYRIAPPAGEFRWVQESLVSDSPVAAVSSAEPASRSQPTAEKQSDTPRRIPESALSSAQELGQYEPVSEPNSNSSRQTKMDTASYVQPAQHDEVFGDDPGTYSGAMGTQANGDASLEYMESRTFISPGGEIEYIDAPPIRSAGQGSTDAFAGWHAIEFTDDGMRFPILERIFSKSHRPSHDPLAQDPFNLATTPKRTSNQPIRVPRTGLMDTVIDSSSIVEFDAPRSSRGAWRDPRTLTRNRSKGSLPNRRMHDYNVSTDAGSSDLPPQPRLRERVARGSAASLQQARDQVDSLRAALRRKMNDVGIGSAGRSSTDLDDSTEQRQPITNPIRSPNDLNWHGLGGEATLQTPPSLDARNVSLDQLHVALSETVAGPMQYWNLSPLVEKTKTVIQNGTSAIERGQARLLLERIEEFQDVANRSFIASRPTGVVGASYDAESFGGGVSLASASSAVAQFAGATNPQDSMPASPGMSQPPYDATGWLVPVHAAGPGQPSYALTDDAGKIIAYVSTMAGANLDHYINKAVGVKGLKGYLPQLQSGHIQAQHVSPIR